MMSLLMDQIKIGLKRDDDTEISCLLSQVSDNNLIQYDEISAVDQAVMVKRELQQEKLTSQRDNPALKDVATTQQSHHKQMSLSPKALTTITSEEQGEIGGMTERNPPATTISTQQDTTTEDQRRVSCLAPQMDVINQIKAATSAINIKNGYITAVQKDQENTSKYNDEYQIQDIQYQCLLYNQSP